MNNRNNLYIGIDQTGAITAKGAPKPLPVCALRGKEISFFYVKRLDREELEKNLGPVNPKQTVICLDCVLGLPASCGISWGEALEKTLAVEGYGRKIASTFFYKLGGGKTHKRLIEMKVKANSVFQEHPFQRNIQTGTFRFWKEIAERRSDFFAPAIERRRNSNQIPIVEGYPSLSWKLLFHSNSRNPTKLRSLLLSEGAPVKFSKEHAKQVKQDSNFGDAFVLAYSLRKLYSDKLFPKLNQEGTILGAELDSKVITKKRK